jgi:putative peptidoglycan lipid II flippase
MAMVASLLLALHWMPAWAEGDMLWRLTRLAGLVLLGVLSYFAVLLVLGFRLRDFARRTAH